MIIWAALVIPLLTVIILAIFFNKRMAWWEYLMVFCAPLLLIGAMKLGVEDAQVRCTEYWGAYLTKATYYEYWNEWITETCYREVACGTDSEGNTEYCTESYDCSHEEDHPPYWEVTNSIGETYSVDQAYFERLCQLWGNKTFVDMHRDFYTVNGNAYTATFDKNYEHTITTTSTHTYENRVQASHSVFNFREFKKGEAQQLGLYEHPPVSGFYQPAVLGPLSSSPDCKYIDFCNAYMGSPSKFRMYILTWQGKGQDIAVQQEAYWKGGNKNEVVVCIGLDSTGKKPEWCRVFGWTKNEDLKINLRDAVVNNHPGYPGDNDNVDLRFIAGATMGWVEGKVVRRDFREFSYLTVDPPTSAVVWTFILTALLSIGLAVYSVSNEFDRDETRYYR